MKCYIYFIINQVTGERYVGQTTNFSRRKKEHFIALKENRHPNIKLQNSYNKYGVENFKIEKITFDDISKSQLDEYEKMFIKQYESYKNGFNLTLGGTGGDCRSKLNFDQYAFAYAGNKKYAGMSNRTAKYLGIDSHAISSLANDKSYDAFRQQYEQLSLEEKNKYLNDFEQKMDIINNPPWIKQKTLDDETTFQILCIVSTYGRGIEKTILEKFQLSKGFVFHIFSGNGREQIKTRYKNTDKNERIKIGKQFFNEWNLQQYAKIKIKEEYKDLFQHYGIAD